MVFLLIFAKMNRIERIKAACSSFWEASDIYLQKEALRIAANECQIMGLDLRDYLMFEKSAKPPVISVQKNETVQCPHCSWSGSAHGLRAHVGMKHKDKK